MNSLYIFKCEYIGGYSFTQTAGGKICCVCIFSNSAKWIKGKLNSGISLWLWLLFIMCSCTFEEEWILMEAEDWSFNVLIELIAHWNARETTENLGYDWKKKNIREFTLLMLFSTGRSGSARTAAMDLVGVSSFSRTLQYRWCNQICSHIRSRSFP